MTEGDPPSFDSQIAAEIDHPEGLLTHWIIIAKFSNADDTTTMCSLTSDNMDATTDLGLAEYHRYGAMRRVFGDD